MSKDIKIFEFDITDSTNSRARAYIREGEMLPALFTAKEQSAGRGRQGKSFFSPKDTGLYMSLALPYSEELKSNTVITAAAAVALLRVLSEYTEKKLSVKWVNDILADSKKVAGILTESVADPKTSEIKAIIIGIGVNITTKSFPDELSGTVTSLGENPLDLKALAFEISNELISILKENINYVISEYRLHSAVLGKNIFYIKNGTRFDAEVTEILNDGSLKVLRSDQTEDILSSGEITLRIK